MWGCTTVDHLVPAVARVRRVAHLAETDLVEAASSSPGHVRPTRVSKSASTPVVWPAMLEVEGCALRDRYREHFPVLVCGANDEKKNAKKKTDMLKTKAAMISRLRTEGDLLPSASSSSRCRGRAATRCAASAPSRTRRRRRSSAGTADDRLWRIDDCIGLRREHHIHTQHRKLHGQQIVSSSSTSTRTAASTPTTSVTSTKRVRSA